TQQRILQLVRRRSHHRQARPPVQKIAIVGESSAKLPIRDLPIVHIPVDETLQLLQILDLKESPLRHASGGLRQRVRRVKLFVIHFVPILAAQVIFWINPEQVGNVSIKSVIDIELARVY